MSHRRIIILHFVSYGKISCLFNREVQLFKQNHPSGMLVSRDIQTVEIHA
jgi:hypothetical protein